jgi:hypothetical protein
MSILRITVIGCGQRSLFKVVRACSRRAAMSLIKTIARTPVTILLPVFSTMLATFGS